MYSTRVQSFETYDETRARAVIDGHSHVEGALLPVLHALQNVFGYIDARAVAPVANALNLSRAEVHGVISFYHDFRAEPPGRHVLKLCRAESCQAMGVEDLVDRLATFHASEPGKTTADGALTLEAVYCLGHCAISPAALIDDEPVGRLDAEKIDALVARCRGASR